MLPIITVFGREIGLYSLCAVIGLLVSGTLFGIRVKKVGLYVEDVVLLILCVVAGLVVGGSALYGLTHVNILIHLIASLPDYSLSQIWQVLQYCFGGSVYYGGLIGGTIAVFLYSRKKNGETKAFLRDQYAVCIPLFHCFGRIGCFLGGCCYGIPSSFGFIAHGNTLVPELNDVRRFPVALTEAAAELALFLLLFLLQKKGKLSGKLIWLYGFLYAIVRFFLEFLRGDAIRGIWLGLSTSQWISIALFIGCGLYFLLGHKAPVVQRDEGGSDGKQVKAPEDL
ncbi:MAG: prolipoprotein diacylglyceryl transferase [Clostridia bacterium]|nr:prolipoprotein diacylglyceryl transferase [Clostridia bacterium]